MLLLLTGVFLVPAFGALLALGAWLSTVSLAEKPSGDVDICLLLWPLVLTGMAGLAALLLWPLTAPIHAFLASGKTRSLADLGEYLRQARYDATKTGVVT